MSETPSRMREAIKKLRDAVSLVETYANQLPSLADESERKELIEMVEDMDDVVTRIEKEPLNV